MKPFAIRPLVYRPLVRIMVALSCLLIVGGGLGAQEGTAPHPPPGVGTAAPGTAPPPPGGAAPLPPEGTKPPLPPGASPPKETTIRLPQAKGAVQTAPAKKSPAAGTQQAAANASAPSGENAKNWIAGNVGFFGAGIQYERTLSPKLSVGAGFYWNSLIASSNLGLEANLRYYPLSGKLKGLFVDAGLGFGVHWGESDWKQSGINSYYVPDPEPEEPEGEGEGEEPVPSARAIVSYPYSYTESLPTIWRGFLVRPGIGWKFDPGRPGGFFIEPHIAVPIVIGTKEADSGLQYDESASGTAVGFILRVALGYAF
jgi:hypothetical protein